MCLNVRSLISILILFNSCFGLDLLFGCDLNLKPYVRIENPLNLCLDLDLSIGLDFDL